MRPTVADSEEVDSEGDRAVLEMERQRFGKSSHSAEVWNEVTGGVGRPTHWTWREHDGETDLWRSPTDGSKWIGIDRTRHVIGIEAYMT